MPVAMMQVGVMRMPVPNAPMPKVAPPSTVVLLIVAPDETVSLPPLCTVVLVAAPLVRT